MYVCIYVCSAFLLTRSLVLIQSNQSTGSVFNYKRDRADRQTWRRGALNRDRLKVGCHGLAHSRLEFAFGAETFVLSQLNVVETVVNMGKTSSDFSKSSRSSCRP